MRLKRLLLLLAAAIIFWSPRGHTFAQSQNLLTPPQTSPAAQEGVQHRVQLQLLVASNAADAKTDYPQSLSAVVKQLKASMPFKNHKLVATYVYNVADRGSLEVSDVTYAEFEPGGALAPKFYSFVVAGIRLNPDGESVHISKLRFELRKRIFIEPILGEGGKPAGQRFDTVGTGIGTELSLRRGVPTVAGTLTSALSDGVLVLVVTVDGGESR